jgi:hypothetical protein
MKLKLVSFRRDELSLGPFYSESGMSDVTANGANVARLNEVNRLPVGESRTL